MTCGNYSFESKFPARQTKNSEGKWRGGNMPLITPHRATSFQGRKMGKIARWAAKKFFKKMRKNFFRVGEMLSVPDQIQASGVEAG
jgi:hypothetical protein